MFPARDIQEYKAFHTPRQQSVTGIEPAISGLEVELPLQCSSPLHHLSDPPFTLSDPIVAAHLSHWWLQLSPHHLSSSNLNDLRHFLHPLPAREVTSFVNAPILWCPCSACTTIPDCLQKFIQKFIQKFGIKRKLTISCIRSRRDPSPKMVIFAKNRQFWYAPPRVKFYF